MGMTFNKTLEKDDDISEVTRNYSKFNQDTKHTFLEAFIEALKI